MRINVLDLAQSTDPYPLRGLLFCICGEQFGRWGSPDTTREYISLCGCRLWPIDASVIERRVYAEVAKAAPTLATGWQGCAGAVLAPLFVRIEVGGTVDDIRFVPRT